MKLSRAKGSSYSVWLIIFIGIIATSYFSYLIYSNARKENSLRFEFEVDQLIDHIKARMNQYETALIQTRAFFLSTPEVSKEKFHEYFENTALMERYPGIQGLGFTQRIPAGELSSHLKKIRKSNPKYHVWPDDPRDVYFSILYLEPLEWRNKKAIGFDMFTESTRRKAMERARDSGIAALSGRVVLVQEQSGSTLPGFNFYLPIYKEGTPLLTVEQRREALLGFIYSPFRTPELFKHILAESSDEIAMEVYEGQTPDKDSLLFNSGNEKDRTNLIMEKSILLESNLFTFRFIANHTFQKDFSPNTILLVILGGLVFTALLLKIFIINETQILQKEKSEKELRKAVRARDEFLSIASHELKTPLTSLKLLNQTYQKKIRKQNGVNLEALLNVFKRSEGQINRIVRLVDDMLDLSRVQSGRLSYHFQEVDLDEIIQEVSERFKEHFEEKGCQLEIHILERARGSFDKDRLEQVLVNLLTNALRYGNCLPVQVELRDLGGYALIKVRDQGIGIAPENHNRIFQRFERVISANEVSGLGIGLYVSRQIVEAHNGKIWVESELGKGSTFIVELPLT